MEQEDIDQNTSGGADVVSEEAVIESTKKAPAYRRQNMEKARLARLEKLKQKREQKANKPKKVLEYNLDSSSSDDSASDVSYEELSEDELPLKKPVLKRQKAISKYNEQQSLTANDAYKDQFLKYMLQQEKKMKQLAKQVRKKPAIKKKTVVQVVQPQSGGNSEKPRSANDVYMDYILGKK